MILIMNVTINSNGDGDKNDASNDGDIVIVSEYSDDVGNE